jgi:hypothetical protein
MSGVPAHAVSSQRRSPRAGRGKHGRVRERCTGGGNRSRRVLGEDHPDTLTSRNNLAGAYQAAGDLDRAIPLLEATLSDCRRALGEDHPLTSTVRRNLRAVTGA